MDNKEGFLNEKTLVLENGIELVIKPTKLKWFTSRDYLVYKPMLETGIANIFAFHDGEDIVKRFISAVLDKAYEKTNEEVDDEKMTYEVTYKFDEEVERIMDTCTITDFIDIINASLEVNGIDPNGKTVTKEA